MKATSPFEHWWCVAGARAMSRKKIAFNSYALHICFLMNSYNFLHMLMREKGFFLFAPTINRCMKMGKPTINNLQHE